MGYSHYWRINEPLKVTKIQKTLIDEVLKEHAIILDVTENSKKCLHFNGIGDESHEDMFVEYGKQVAFSFCKTARKPYDIAVCKVLLILSLSKGFKVSSDGDMQGEEWKDACLWFIKKGYEDTLKKKVFVENE